jgi:hypothetical protein
MSISSTEREQRLYEAIEKLAKFYGLRDSKDDVDVIARTIINGRSAATTAGDAGTSSTNEQTVSDITDILMSLINSPAGANLSETIATVINERFVNNTGTGEAGSGTNNYPIGNKIQIIGDTPEIVSLRNTLPCPENHASNRGIISTTYRDAIKKVSIFSNENNSIPIIQLDEAGQAEMAGKNLSIIMITSPNLDISSYNTKAVSMFLNGVPAIELSKAVPYLDVQFELPIPALDSEGKLLSPSIYKFMLGGVQANEPSPLWSMQSAFSSSNQGEERNYSTLGMEAFVSPQIIFNRRYAGDANDIRANQVLDPTRPILSINSFSTNEIASYAAFGYRSAELRMTLHDRSRMPDVAPFFRADLRGTTRVKIEYGWHHPEGEDLIRPRRGDVNPYVDLINGMRKVEKFQIRNSSFSFKDNGSVEMNLDLVTLGQSQMATELIIQDPSSDLLGAIRALETLQERLSTLLARTNLLDESSDDRPTVEIHGTEILHAASDAFASGFSLSTSSRRDLNALLNNLTNTPRANVLVQIRDTLIDIWGDTRNGRRARTTDRSVPPVERVRTQVTRDVADQVNEIRQYCIGRPSGDREVGWEDTESQDPLVVRTRDDRPRDRTALAGLYGVSGLSVPNTRSTDRPGYLTRGSTYGDGLQQYSASLATIMAHFIARPLLRTGAYKEVQLIFYPFNAYAAYAHKINIGNFEINLGQLTEMLISYRMSNLSRSATMTLLEFWNFLNTNFIDNPGASAYGLWNTNGSGFYSHPRGTARRTELAGEGPNAVTRYVSEPATDETTLNANISTLLARETPNGEFHPPQLRLFTECLPVRDSKSGNIENVLKIHIYDQQTDSVSGAGELLIAERNRALSLEGRPESTLEGTALSREWRRRRDNLINSAVRAGVLAAPPGESSNRLYIQGGSRAIKDFLMQNMAYLIPGMRNSLIKTVNLNSLQDEMASTLNLVNSPRTPELIAPNGEEPGSLPLQIIPVEMTMTTQGCPLIGFGNMFFVDLQTGTTADDIYRINNISSEIEPGKYTSTIKLRPVSGYTRYRNYLNEIRTSIETVAAAEAANREAREADIAARSGISPETMEAVRADLSGIDDDIENIPL